MQIRFPFKPERLQTGEPSGDLRENILFQEELVTSSVHETPHIAEFESLHPI